jgi:hypothetical protein
MLRGGTTRACASTKEAIVTAKRSERTRVVADLAWLGGLTQVVFGLALLASPESPRVAAILAIAAGTLAVVAGAMLLNGLPTSWTSMTFAFVLSIGASAYALWVATPYWWGAAVSGVLALAGLIIEWTDRMPRPTSAPGVARRRSRRPHPPSHP